MDLPELVTERESALRLVQETSVPQELAQDLLLRMDSTTLSKRKKNQERRSQEKKKKHQER